MASSWLDRNNSLNFKNTSLEEQLERILGQDEAQHFLKPIIEEKSPSSTVEQLTQKLGRLNVQSLWSSLRTSSSNKLITNTKSTQDFYVLKTDFNGKGLQKVEEYKHKVKLMHKVAHLNEAKTRQILKLVKLPTLSGMFLEDSGPQQYHVENLKLPTIRGSSSTVDATTGNKNCRRRKTVEEETQNLSFLSDADCRVTGRFRQRMKKVGIESSTGIIQHIQPQHPKIVSMSYLKENLNQDMEKQTREQSRRTCSRSQNKEDNTRNSKPLTLKVLAEYINSLPCELQSTVVHFDNNDVAVCRQETT